MLQFLKLNNFLLFKNQQVSFTGNFTVITGETGSGKSMFIKALRFVLGEKLDNLDLSSTETSVIAEFSSNSKPLKDLLAESDIEFSDSTIILRRTLTKDGKGKVFVNDVPITLKFLKKISDELVEFHSQHKQLEAFNQSNSLKIIDQFTETQTLLSQVSQLYQQIVELNKDLEEKQKEKHELEQNQENIEYAYKELKTLNLKEDEETELLERKKLFNDKIKITHNIEALLAILMKDEGIISKLIKAQRNLARLENINLEEHIETAIFHLNELQTHVENKLAEFDTEDTIENIEERLSKIKELSRKYRCTSNQLLGFKEEYENKLQTLSNINTQIKAKILAKDKLLAEYLVKAEILSQARSKAASFLENKIIEELKQLKLEQVEFKIEINSNLRPITARGIDQTKFLIKTNKGFNFAPIDEIASGGELSRIMLAFKVALAEANQKTTIIFDEIDAGTGGAVAQTIGNRMKKLAENNQIITISHQPQVAAKAQQHLLVEKSNSNITETTIVDLNLEQKTQEIARMLAGINITDTAVKAALSLMEG